MQPSMALESSRAASSPLWWPRILHLSHINSEDQAPEAAPRRVRLDADLALLLVAWANLLWPTSAPLRANGIPLNNFAEFWLASVLSGWVMAKVGLAVMKRAGLRLQTPRKLQIAGRFLSIAGVLVGFLLLLIRFATPPGTA